MSTLFKAISLLFGFLIILIACNRAGFESETPLVPVDNADIQNSARIGLFEDALHFRSKAEFDSTLMYLRENQDKLDIWERDFSNFKSMRTKYNELSDEDLEKTTEQNIDQYNGLLKIITDKDGETEIDRMIDDPVLSTIVNERGYVIVGDRAYRFSFEELSFTDLKNVDLLKNITENKSRIGSIPIESRLVPITSSGRILARVETCSNEYQARRRVKGEIWITSILEFYSGAGVRTKHQRRTAGVWFRQKIDKLALTVNARITQYVSGIIPPVADFPVSWDSGWKDNEGQVEFTFESCIFVDCTFEVSDSNNSHRAQANGVIRTCTTNF
ncbi:hypothetical protein DSL64_15475 [Dyadobacter luteus]|uniref:DUF4848 domain-containing protein n=1 Tax=Dyadobacter luteus TaxID=2259619 RepID=A0A3D8YAG3_9BACT|nr:hypothetical protein [Dyadobacter luteus]REA60080.1 hypothetical protein DSL64_15475 [Dyadobacter luteus]